jgi:hypothetical protein
MQIDSSDEQSEKAYSPKAEILAPDSNSSSRRLLQRRKQNLEIVSIDDGMQIG